MDEKILNQFCNNQGVTDQQSLQYFEHLKQLDNGWQLCLNALINRSYVNNDQAYYFLLQVVEHFLKTRYENAMSEEATFLRTFLLDWLQNLSTRPERRNFIVNKFSQLFVLAFLSDYPAKWPSFFNDLLVTLNMGAVVNHEAVDVYFRILMTLHEEVVDRNIPHTEQELKRNTFMKDFMREHSINLLVSSCHEILVLYESLLPSLPLSSHILVSCLEAIGAYISWIDISLIANDRFVSIFLRLIGGHSLNRPTSLPVLVRGEACECLAKVVGKGMEPMLKVKLVESVASVLGNSGLMCVAESADDEYLVKFAGLVNSFGTQLVHCWQKFIKDKDAENAKMSFDAIQAKLLLLLKLLADDDDDVSRCVIPFISSYVGLLKQIPSSDARADFLKNVLPILAKKMKYDDSYDFADENDDDSDFLEYRKELKVIFVNLSSLNRDMFIQIVKQVFTEAMEKLQFASFPEVEVSLYILFLLEEASAGSNEEMIRTMILSNVSCYPHPAVQLQFFEIVVRYEKFFATSTQFIPEVLKAFLDERGLWNSHCHVRSRVAYLFSRFVKSINKQHIQNYLEMILTRIQGLLVLSTTCIPMQSKKPDGQGSSLIEVSLKNTDTTNLQLSVDDQQFMFETASVLIIQSSFPPEKKRELMKSLVFPILSQFNELMMRLMTERDEIVQAYLAQLLNLAMSFISRTSKGFSGHQTVHSNGCLDIFVEAVMIFIKVLKVPVQQHILHQGFRQFLHRMVICLDRDILQFTPEAVEGLMTSGSIKQLYDFIPFLNQLIQKFKKTIVQYMQQVFVPIVSVIQSALATAIDEGDQVTQVEKKMLRRGYFSFISIIVNNDTSEILSNQNSESLGMVLDTIIQGATDCSDPASQKSCFCVLKKMVEIWDDNGAVRGFKEFIYEKIVPCCFLTPFQPCFDLCDAQAILVLNEIANCLEKVHNKKGKGLVEFLTFNYLPPLNIPLLSIEDFCRHLIQADEKAFQNYFKAFFTQLRGIHS